MLQKKFSFVRIFSLFTFLLVSTFLFQTCSNDEPTAPEQPTDEFEYSNPTIHTVDSAPNSVIHDSATGVTLLFPEGGSGDVAISKILSVPLTPMEGNGVRIEYSGDTPIDLVVDTSDGSIAEVLEYGNFTGCFDDEIGDGKRWAAVPRGDTDGSEISFMLMMPYDLAKSVAVKPIGSNDFWIARLKPGSDLIEQRVATELQILTFYKQFIETLPASIKSKVETKAKSRFVRVKYDGGAYYAGFWMRVFGKGVTYEPTVHLGLPPRTQQIAHELGHYLIHLLVGDDIQVKLENQGNLSGKHAVLDVVGRNVILEDLAYFTEFVLTQLGADAYNLFEPYDMLKGLSPLKNDFPSYEGFAAHLLAQLIRTEPKIRDFETGQYRNIPLVNLNYGKVFEIISKGATDINTLRKNIEDHLGAQSNKLPVICHRLGWRYLAEGRLVDSEGNPVPNASIEPIVIINGVVYKGMEGAATSDSDGAFVLSGEAFPGKSILRVKLSSADSTDVPIFIDWDNPTTKAINLGDIDVTPKRNIVAVNFYFGYTGTYQTKAGTITHYDSFWNEGFVDNTTIQTNGNTVYVQEIYNYTDHHINVSTELVFDNIQNPVNIISIKCNATDYYIPGESNKVRFAEARNIPVLEVYDNGTREFVCDGNISQNLLNLTYVETDNNNSVTKELLSFESEGRISIMVYYEE